MQAYDELKRRLLNEYKKLTSSKKSFDDQVRERYKSMKQRGVSGKKTAQSSATAATTSSNPSNSTQAN